MNIAGLHSVAAYEDVVSCEKSVPIECPFCAAQWLHFLWRFENIYACLKQSGPESVTYGASIYFKTTKWKHKMAYPVFAESEGRFTLKVKWVPLSHTMLNCSQHRPTPTSKIYVANHWMPIRLTGYIENLSYSFHATESNSPNIKMFECAMYAI